MLQKKLHLTGSKQIGFLEMSIIVEKTIAEICHLKTAINKCV